MLAVVLRFTLSAVLLGVCLWVGVREPRARRGRAGRVAIGALRVVAFAVLWILAPITLLAALTWRTTFAESFMEDIADHGDVIVGAIGRYTHDRGHAPAELSELVPAYLTELPPTGCPCDDTWHYSRDTNRWSLLVSINEWGNYDEIAYLSAGEPGHPARVRSRCRGWMYLDVFE